MSALADLGAFGAGWTPMSALALATVLIFTFVLVYVVVRHRYSLHIRSREFEVTLAPSLDKDE